MYFPHPGKTAVPRIWTLSRIWVSSIAYQMVRGWIWVFMTFPFSHACRRCRRRGLGGTSSCSRSFFPVFDDGFEFDEAAVMAAFALARVAEVGVLPLGDDSFSGVGHYSLAGWMGIISSSVLVIGSNRRRTNCPSSQGSGLFDMQGCWNWHPPNEEQASPRFTSK